MSLFCFHSIVACWCCWMAVTINQSCKSMLATHASSWELASLLLRERERESADSLQVTQPRLLLSWPCKKSGERLASLRLLALDMVAIIAGKLAQSPRKNTPNPYTASKFLNPVKVELLLHPSSFSPQYTNILAPSPLNNSPPPQISSTPTCAAPISHGPQQTLHFS